EDRQVEDVFRRRAGQALADVEKVGNNEDGEERRLGHDEPDHAGAPASGPATHGARPGRRDAAHPTKAAGWSRQARSPSCTPGAARSWPTPEAKPPRGCLPPARPPPPLPQCL